MLNRHCPYRSIVDAVPDTALGFRPRSAKDKDVFVGHTLRCGDADQESGGPVSEGSSRPARGRPDRGRIPGIAAACSRILRSRRQPSATTSTIRSAAADSSSMRWHRGRPLITDAGTPAVSDPGADLVTAALDAGYRVSPIPGPSAVAAAVSASGLIDGPFLTLGFLPRERGERLRLVARAATAGVPLVMFESAQRIGRTLQELVEILGDRRAVVLRELTKIHEEVRADSLSELRQWAEKRRHGVRSR